MAKIGNGYMSGFSGTLGPAVGYQWNGKWCMRSRPTAVRNPRTDKQMAHRAMFRQQVRLAARMRWAVTTALTGAAREAGMTSYNLFVSINQHAFGDDGGRLAVDWPTLQLSHGPVAPVALGEASLTADGRLEVDFERNPMHLASSAFDQVRLYVYCPALERGFLAAPVYRRDQHIAVMLPAVFAAEELHLYAFVCDRQGRYSPTAHGMVAPAGEAPAAEPLAVGSSADSIETADNQPLAPQQAVAVEAADTAAAATDSGPDGGRADPAQLSLW